SLFQGDEEKTSKLLEYFNQDEMAASTWLRKYALKNKEGFIVESTPDEMHKRMAKEFARIEENYVIGDLENNKNLLSTYGKLREDLEEESIYQLFKDFKYIIPQGSIMSQLGAKSIGSLSNCFVIGQPEDSYGGIFHKDEQLAQLMKRRGGVGIDISTLRPEGTSTSNAAKSSTGAISFMHRFSNTTREVAQNGRRGALMISININHPDVMEFIKIKRDLTQVTGANISIKLNDEFMKAVENDEDYALRFPCDTHYYNGKENYQGSLGELSNFEYNQMYEVDQGVYVKRIKAKEYWNEIIKSAHNVAEPGLMFWDNMVNYSPDGVYEQFKQVTTNPCSEIAMQPYDACRLIAVNLYSFVKNPFTDKAEFNFKKFYEVNYEAMRLSDDLIDLEIEHINKILQKIAKDPESGTVKDREFTLWTKVLETAQASRRTGLGFTALGDTLAALGLKYDSDEALEIIEKIMKMKMESELDCTIDLAILRGTFEGYDKNLESDEDDNGSFGNNDFYQFVKENFNDAFYKMKRFGRRNVSWSTVAPTGTVSLMCQTTSGIEPLFMGYYMRRRKASKGDRVDFTDQNGDTWQEFPVLHPKFNDWCELQEDMLYNIDEENPNIKVEELSKEQLTYLFEMSPWFKSTANDIDWIKRVEIQSIIQKYITHSISSTINLPEDVSEKEVSDIYLESWKKGLKGITVYRDGSRSGVLISNNDKKLITFNDNHSPKRPKKLNCKIIRFNN
ncbi:MAG: adenosylcobalamin-dependent ribonucleoside-diphosphate reductase, partial [Romboutsia sp.]|nr:adenosylcobalamin-dependent ribonucleoside-diphosphate reductase [Romboutsia sp.]